MYRSYRQCNRLARRVARQADKVCRRAVAFELSKLVWEEGHMMLSRPERARGLRGAFVRGRTAARALASTRRRLSRGAAAAAVLATVVRHPESRTVEGTLIALHGEWSNRTRHVVKVFSRFEEPVDLILLGRGNPTELLQHMKQEVRLREIVRPYDAWALVRTLGLAREALDEVGAACETTGFLPAWRDEIAVMYRVWMGVIAADWWHRHGRGAGPVCFGHTGLGDTDALERAMQASGRPTVHVVHGVSGGWHFAGSSSLAIFRCKHDAQMHAAFGGYGRCAHVALDRPQRRQGRGVLMFTNYVHPANPFHGRGAVALALAALRAALTVWRAMLPDEPFVWRPHPLFWTFAGDVTDPLVAEVEFAGGEVSRPDDPFPDPGASRVVISTPSTTVMDCLIAGAVPILMAPAPPPPPEVVYANLPLRASCEQSLLRCVCRLLDSPEQAFSQSWEAVGPGRSVKDMAEVLGILGSLDASSAVQRCR